MKNHEEDTQEKDKCSTKFSVPFVLNLTPAHHLPLLKQREKWEEKREEAMKKTRIASASHRHFVVLSSLTREKLFTEEALIDFNSKEDEERGCERREKRGKRKERGERMFRRRELCKRPSC